MPTINFTVKGYWRRFRHRKWMPIISLLLSITIAVFIALATTPMYRTTTTLVTGEIVEGGDVLKGFWRLPIPVQGHLTSAQEHFAMMIKPRLLSHTLLMRVAESLQLRDYLGRQRDLKIANTGSSLKKNWRKLQERLRLRKPQTELINVQIVDYLRSMISVRMRSTSRIEISTTDSDPQLAKDVANKLAKNYVDDVKRRRLDRVRNTYDFIQNQLLVYKTKLDFSEQALENAKQSGQSGLSHLLIKKKVNEKRYAFLLEKLDDLDFLIATELRQMGEFAEVLDPAILPKAPIKPNKKMIIAAGVAVGLGIGLGLLLISAFIDWSRPQQES